jgi:hypothetical protein
MPFFTPKNRFFEIFKPILQTAVASMPRMLNLTGKLRHNSLRKAGFLLIALTLSACGEAPSWQKLLAAKITQQYPDYKAVADADGSLLVERPGLAPVPVDVDDIAKFCLRGPKDCNYATDQMLTSLQGK